MIIMSEKKNNYLFEKKKYLWYNWDHPMRKQKNEIIKICYIGEEGKNEMRK